jgi:hypothetical protein
MRVPRFLICLLLLAVTLSASALDRPFPQNAKRGKMSPAIYPTIVIDGKLRRLSAGSMIRNQGNLIQMPATIASGEYIVNYTENSQGEIANIWILTDVEAHQPLRRQ